jgi:hypothetical protein
MLSLIGSLLLVAGCVVMVAGGLWFILAAFKKDVVWGLACALTGIANLAFLVLHWDTAKRPFFFEIGGLAVAVVGALLSDGFS